MQRLPLILAIIICAIWIIISLPILIILWLLGGNNPFDNMIEVLNNIIDLD